MKEENCMGAKLSLTGPRRKLTLVFEIQNGRHCLASSARKSSFFFFFGWVSQIRQPLIMVGNGS